MDKRDKVNCNIRKWEQVKERKNKERCNNRGMVDNHETFQNYLESAILAIYRK